MKTFFLILVIRYWVFLKPTLTVVKGYLSGYYLYVGVVVSLWVNISSFAFGSLL